MPGSSANSVRRDLAQQPHNIVEWRGHCGSLGTMICVRISASFFHRSSQPQPLPAGREKLKCVYLYRKSYKWKSLTFCTGTCVMQLVVGNFSFQANHHINEKVSHPKFTIIVLDPNICHFVDRHIFKFWARRTAHISSRACACRWIFQTINIDLVIHDCRAGHMWSFLYCNNRW